jgi:formyl-CoA transferase
MGYPAYYTDYGGAAPKRTGSYHAAVAPYGPFTAGDGKGVLLSIQNEREWEWFCAGVLETPAMTKDPLFATNSDRVRNRDELHRRINAVFKTLTVDQLVERLERARIAYGRNRTVEEFLEHPQLDARGRWGEMETPKGKVWALKPPVDISGVAAEFAPVPAVGQHTDSILASVGYSDADIAGLHKSGAV